MLSDQNIVVVGEVLFDCFPDGRKVPGGAPFNVAWNLQALGGAPLFVSAIGSDSLGYELKQIASDWGISLDTLSILDAYSTSVVSVEFNNGSPEYTILEDTAMDHLQIQNSPFHGRNSILYHGSLAFRREESMGALKDLRANWKGLVFVDINIRNPWFSLNRFETMIKGIDYLKLNDDEFYQLTGSVLNLKNPLSQLGEFASCYGIKNIILTCGQQGALWFSSNRELLITDAVSQIKIADTVGAGDGFASICLLGIQQGWTRQDILQRASIFAGKICTLQGATTSDRRFYQLS